jgi:hypothetical protein
MNGRECVLLSIILVCIRVLGTRYLWASLAITKKKKKKKKKEVGGQPTEGQGGRGTPSSDMHATSYCPLALLSSLRSYYDIAQALRYFLSIVT